jgi:flagellar hook-associated protein 2
MQTSIANSLGIGSGLDTAKLIADLAAASRQPKVERLDGLQRANQSKISALAQARSDLESFATSLANLVTQGSLQSQPSVSDTSILDASAIAGVGIGAFSGEMVVTQLARAQTLASAPVASTSAPIGQGSFTLVVGAAQTQITIDASNNSLDGLVAAINESGAGIRASIASDANGARLILKGASGAASAFTVTGEAALAAFAYPGGTMTLAQGAQDAAFTLDGVAYQRSSNSIADLIPGMALTLKKADPATLVTIGTTHQGGALRSTLTDFVSVYNTLRRDISAARVASGGDSGLSGLERQLAALISQPLKSTGPVRRLSDIGIATNRDGSLRFNDTQLDAALKANPDAVEALFAPPRDRMHTTETDPGIGGALLAIKDAATAPSGALEGLKKRLDKVTASIATDRTRMEARETAYRDRLTRTFGTMDTRVSALKATQSYLEQQIKIWSSSRN